MSIFRLIHLEKGIIVGALLLLTGFAFALVMSQGAVSIYFSAASFFIVVFGSLGAVSLSVRMENLMTSLSHTKHAFIKNTVHIEDSIETCIHLANLYRKRGILSLENEKIEDQYIQHCVELLLDGYDSETIEHMLNKEIFYARQRHEKTIEVLETLAETTPAMGMIGTLIGLVAMLSGLTTPDTIGQGMAVALLTTLYGAVLANCLLNPMARRMTEYSTEVFVHQSLVRDAIIKIANKEPPRAIFEFLQTYIAKHKRRTLKELNI